MPFHILLRFISKFLLGKKVIDFLFIILEETKESQWIDSEKDIHRSRPNRQLLMRRLRGPWDLLSFGHLLFHACFWQPVPDTVQGLLPLPGDLTHHHRGMDTFPGWQISRPQLSLWYARSLNGVGVTIMLWTGSSRCLVFARFTPSDLFGCFSSRHTENWFCD